MLCVDYLGLYQPWVPCSDSQMSVTRPTIQILQLLQTHNWTESVNCLVSRLYLLYILLPLWCKLWFGVFLHPWMINFAITYLYMYYLKTDKVVYYYYVSQHGGGSGQLFYLSRLFRAAQCYQREIRHTTFIQHWPEQLMKKHESHTTP